MANILTYNNLVEMFKDIATRHYQINTFLLGRDWELENNQSITYPLLQIYPEVARMPKTNGEYKTVNITFVCKVIDYVWQDESNEKDVHSDTFQISQDVVNEINQHPYYQRSNTNLIGDINFSSLEEFEDDFTAGWQFNLEVQLINHNSFCGLPFENIPNFSFQGPSFSGEIYSVQYLTCDDIQECPTIIGIQNSFDNYLPLSGGVINGDITANTYYGDGSNLTGISSSDTYTTGFTYNNNNTLTIEDNSGNTLSASIDIMSGLTINGDLVTTTISATTYYGLPEIEIPANLTFFSTTSASDVVGYSKLVISLDDPDYNTVPVNVSTGAITTTGQLVGSLISDAGIFAGNPGAINISTIGEIRRTGGSGVAEFYYEVYQRNNLGVETLICTSNKTPPVTTSVYQQFQASSLFNNGTWLETDRVVIKYYGDRIPGASNPTYDFLFGGTNPVRTLFPISAQLLLNVPITIGITGVVSGTTDYVLTVDSNGKLGQIDPNLATFTIDLIDNSTVDFYAPDDLRINTVTIINGTGTETIEVNDAPYTLTNLINQGDKITVSVTTPSVLNLNSRYE